MILPDRHCYTYQYAMLSFTGTHYTATHYVKEFILQYLEYNMSKSILFSTIDLQHAAFINSGSSVHSGPAELLPLTYNSDVRGLQS